MTGAPDPRHGGDIDRMIRAAIDSLPFTSLMLVDVDMRYRAVLGTAVAPHGYRADELVGRRVEDVLSEMLYRLVEPRLRRALAGEAFTETAASTTEIGVYESTYGPVVEDGVVVAAFVVVRDVTIEQRALTELAAIAGHRPDRGCDPEPADLAVELDLHAELRGGLERGELTVFYQPIVDLLSAEVVAREALVRWQHPVRGLLSPAAFLNGLDRSTLAVTLGEYMLRRACAAAVTWPDDAAVHVNISARHLAEPGLVAVVDACLRSTGLPAQRLVLEVTESFVLAASPATLAATRDLTELGVGLSLDDFGTGYSSLTALHWLPIDSFKIDRSFIADTPYDPTSNGLVLGLIGLGAHMGLDVIAEGIETQEQADWLLAHGCTHGQGYHLGRPAPGPVLPPTSARLTRAGHAGAAGPEWAGEDPRLRTSGGPIRP